MNCAILTPHGPLVKWSTHLVLIQAFRGSNPLRPTKKKKKESQAFFLKCHYIKNGWGNWIRTSEMADSESAALPLGYTPTTMFIIHKTKEM